MGGDLRLEVHGMKNCRWVGWLTGGVNGDPIDGMYLSAWEIARDRVRSRVREMAVGRGGEDSYSPRRGGQPIYSGFSPMQPS
jgi:hypothetical protein